MIPSESCIFEIAVNALPSQCVCVLILCPMSVGVSEDYRDS